MGFLRAHKFKCSTQEFWLGYVYKEDELILTLLKLVVHEKFYRDIKNEIGAD